jgi:hypothetical protein
MSTAPLVVRDAHVKARLTNTFFRINKMFTELQINLDGYVYLNGCESRLFNPLHVPLEALDQIFTPEWNGAAFDFYLHNTEYEPCCSVATLIARGVYAVTMQGEDARATYCTIRSVQLDRLNDNLCAITRRYTIESTYVPDRQTTRIDTKVSNTMTLMSISELNKVLEEFLSLVSLGVTHMFAPPEEV